jgi:hypothetical protein
MVMNAIAVMNIQNMYATMNIVITIEPWDRLVSALNSSPYGTTVAP